MPLISACACTTLTPGFSFAKTPQGAVRALGAVGVHRHGDPNVYAAEHLQVRRQDAHHRSRHPINRDAAAHDGGVPTELALPETVAEQGHARPAGPIFLGEKRAAKHRLDSQHVEEPGRRFPARHPLGLAPGHHVQAILRQGEGHGHPLERLALLFPVQVIGLGGGDLKEADLLVGLPDADHPLGVRHRQRPQQNRAHDAEDGAVGPNPERQREHRHHGEPGALQQHPNGEPLSSHLSR
jgi:hypothetical protein